MEEGRLFGRFFRYFRGTLRWFELVSISRGGEKWLVLNIFLIGDRLEVKGEKKKS